MKKTFLMLTLCLSVIVVRAAGKLTITVEAGIYDRIDCVVSADVSFLNINESSSVELYEKSGKEERPVSCQLIFEEGKAPRLYWVLEGKTRAGDVRTFVARKTKKSQPSAGPVMSVEDTRKALVLQKGGKGILQYNYAHTEPPAGADKAYGRSGFIHPAYSPDGNILTTIQPKDHYHHYGIWNPWTRVLYDGETYDLWNLKDKQGTVKARNIETVYQGSVLAGYTAALDHYIFTPSEEKIILNERWNIKAWNVPDGFLWDFESRLSPSTPLPVLLKEYRYAGFGYRATEEWTKENCEMMTSEGKTRRQIDGSTARWIYITGDTQTGRSGLLFLGHPGNYNSPEPLRIWDENANGGRGDAFINFAPTKNKDWELRPGEQYVLRYRLFSYEGEMTKERADRLWNDLAHPPVVIINPHPTVSAVQTGNRIDVTIGNQFFTGYHFAENEKYPFFFPVNGPLSGGSVTSMRNGEYPHHSSLFFACDRVNGGNYWQEGLERGRIVSIGARITESGGERVVIEDECIWKRPDAPSPVIDRRKITVSAPSEKMYQIDFDIEMEMLADVTILKTNHSLFSARIDLDLTVRQGGVMINADGKEGEKATFGAASPWIDCYGTRKTGVEGIVIMQHPSNKWYPSPWFTRDYGFISPTPMYWPADDKATELKKGEVIKLRYRVLVHAGDTRQAGIAGEFERYKRE